MTIQELEAQLASAQRHLKQVLSRGLHMERFAETAAAFKAVASAQRALAAARGEEHAVPYDIGFVPEAAVSKPVSLQTDYAAILSFSAMREMPTGKREDAGHGVVEFELCSATKFGYPNDEALPGHPLYEKGLSAYGVFEVRDSAWIRLTTEQNRVAFPDTPDETEDRHFIFTFHDSTFECIARGLRAWLSDKPYPEIFDDMRARVFKRG